MRAFRPGIFGATIPPRLSDVLYLIASAIDLGMPYIPTDLAVVRHQGRRYSPGTLRECSLD